MNNRFRPTFRPAIPLRHLLSCCLLAGLPLLGSASLNAASVVAGNRSTFYISGSGDVFAWGANGSGQLGDGSVTDRLDPIISATQSKAAPWVKVVTNLTGVANSSLEGHTVAIHADGTLWAWGDNSFGQLGQGDTLPRPNPVQVGSAANWVDVEVGSAFTVALDDNGKIWLWGDNRFGQLGPDIDETFSATPTRLPDKDGSATHNDVWVEIAAGAEHVLAIHERSSGLDYGHIWAWGRNSVEQLGLGAGQASSIDSPQRINDAGLWRLVEAGTTSSFAINRSAELHAWGEGAFGGLGLGANGGTAILGAASPTQVAGTRRFIDVSAGTSHTLAWSSTGQLFGTGQNASGQLGITGPVQLYSEFQFIDGNVAAASAGRAYSIVLRNDGTVETVGSNDRGQLGIGSTTTQSNLTPTTLGAVDLSIESLTLTTPLAGLAEGDALQSSSCSATTGPARSPAPTSRPSTTALP